MTATADRHAVRPRLLVSLLAGRGAYRLTQYASAFILLPVWGEAEYGRYAAAVGTCTWLGAVTCVAPEKAALRLLPRARRSHAPLLGAFLAVAWLPLPLVVAFLVAVVSASEGVQLYLAVAALATSLGANLLLVGLQRVTGTPSRDAANYAVLTVATLALTAVAAFTGLGPVGYVAALLATVSVVDVGLVTRLGRPSLAAARRPALRRLLGHTVVLMSGSELCLYAATSVLFLELSLTGWSEDSAVLYPVVLAWSAIANVFFYVLRVYQPRVAQRRTAGGAAAGQARALRLARVALGLASVWLVAVGLAVATADRSPDAGLPAVLPLVAIVVSRTPGFLLLAVASYLMENADDRSLRVSALGSAAALAVVVVVGTVVVPARGALGVLWVSGAMDVVQAATLLVLGRRRREPASRDAGNAGR